jgi:hypothetical protein
MSPTSRLVTTTLLRIYRPVALWFLGLMVFGVAVANLVIARFTDPGFSLWLFAGSVGQYWLLVVGILLVTMHLRQYVSNGVTRRDFLTGVAVFGLVLAVFFALLVPVGHGIEYALLRLNGRRGAGYPPFSLAVAVGEFGHALPGALAFGVSGIAVSAAFYRYGGWGGCLALLPAVLPIAASQAFLGIDDHGELSARFVPYVAALAMSLAVTAVAAVLYHRTLRDVPIRRTAG